MSETPQHQSGTDEAQISSSSLTDDRAEPQGTPTTGSAGSTAATDPEPVATGDLNVEAAPTTEPGIAPPAEKAATEVEVPPPAAEKISNHQSTTDKIAELTNQRDAFQSQYLRIAADFDNFRKRSSKEKEEIETQVKCATIIELLSVVDNFERARTQIKPQNDGELGIHKSYQGVYKQLVESLKRVGVSPMRPEGQQFDPNLHEAVMRQPTEEYPEGTVIEELQRGYYLGDRILRHSLVKVAAPPEQLSADDASGYDPTQG
jgi:molecular chaperone GrpE